MRRIAMLIGVSEYEDRRITPLRFAAADVTAAAGVLRDRCAFDSVVVVTGKAATRSKVVAQLRVIDHELHPDDVFLLLFIGHAVECADGLCMLTADSKDDRPEETGVRLPMLLRSLMLFFPAGQRALIFDCWQHRPGGRRSDADDERTDAMTGDIQAIARKTASSMALHPTTAVLFAYSQNQRWCEGAADDRGVLTRFLLDGISSSAWTDKQLTTAGLARFMSGQLERWSQFTVRPDVRRTLWYVQNSSADLVLGERHAKPASATIVPISEFAAPPLPMTSIPDMSDSAASPPIMEPNVAKQLTGCAVSDASAPRSRRFRRLATLFKFLPGGRA